MIKASVLLSLLLAFGFPNPAEPVVCAIVKRTYEGDNFNCRSRPDISLLDLGGPGCQLSCLSKNSTCAVLGDSDEVCGKLRIRVGVYALGRAVYQFCVVPDGLLARPFGRYCLTVRYCAARQRVCGCRIIADGLPCGCRIKMVDGQPTPVSNCPLVNQRASSNAESFMRAVLPSEYEVESEISAQMTDAELADQLNEAYALFLDHIASLE